MSVTIRNVNGSTVTGQRVDIRGGYIGLNFGNKPDGGATTTILFPETEWEIIEEVTE